jgi:hypothetical protein
LICGGGCWFLPVDFVVCGSGCWFFPIDFMGLWLWLLGFVDRFRGFVVVVVGFCQNTVGLWWWLLIFADRFNGFVVVVVGFLAWCWLEKKNIIKNDLF